MRSLRGGNVKFEPVPVQTYGFEYGGNESENAAKMLSSMADKQNQMNSSLSGGRGNRIKRGGSNGIEIPQFTIPGPKVSDQNANTSSLQLNSLLINAANDASNDTKIGQSGGRYRKTKKNRRCGSKLNHKRGCRCKMCKMYRRSCKSKKSKARKYRR